MRLVGEFFWVFNARLTIHLISFSSARDSQHGRFKLDSVLIQYYLLVEHIEPKKFMDKLHPL